jgi:uncharacterized protein
MHEVTLSPAQHISSDRRLTAKEFCLFVASLLAVGRAIYGDASAARRAKKTAMLVVNGIRHRAEFQQVHSVFLCSDLEEVLELFPAILEKPFSPYVCVDWNISERARQLQSHFSFVKDHFGARAAKIYGQSGYRLFAFDTREGERYSIELFQGYQNEGSMGIRLCDSEKREVYSLSFHLSDDDGKVCYVGAVQGPNDRVPDRQKMIVALTRSLHGLRPKALMVEVLYMLANSLNIDSIYGVSNEGHIYQYSHYFNKQKSLVEFDYDLLWNEYQATIQSCFFFKFAKEPVRKDIATLKSSKRSLYRKRYAWLEAKAIDTDNALSHLVDKYESESFDSERELAA